MHRIDGAGHVAHMFVAEDAATNRPPTEITPEIMNAFQEELAGFIEWAGIVLAKGDNTQLRQGLLEKFAPADVVVNKASWDVVDSVITSAGLAVNHVDATLLRQAISKMIQGGQHSVVINNAVFSGAVAGTGKAVYWDSANARFDLALADGTSKQNMVGFADVANANVYAFGDAVLFAGLTPGARYYLDGTTAGAINATAPTNAVFVGIARTATEVFVDIDAVGGAAPKQIQPIAASVAANALTLTLNPTSLDFRSSALTSGTVNTRAIAAAISLVVPSAATLGTVNATTARLALLAIDNAGTVELAVVNLSGGNNLDETTLISTTAISAGATAKNVIYSTTARMNVPFRIAGFVDLTETTAGTWATAPSTIQGIGGQALAALSSLGYGQAWIDVTGSRVVGTTYYNTTGKPICVCAVGANAQTSSMSILVNGVTAASTFASLGGSQMIQGVTTVVPVGASYVFNTPYGMTVCSELR